VQGLRRFEDFAVRDEVETRTATWWALVALALTAVLVVVLGFLYLRPPGRSELRALMNESGGIISGTEVRIAGIPVGNVTKVRLVDDKVEATLEVKTDVPIGDQTSMDVRMLTIVGGAFVALHPAGSGRLGTDPIPPDRITVPYSLSEVMDSAAKTATEIDATAMRRVAVTTGDMLKSKPGAVRSILSDVEKLTATLDQQQRQVSRVAALGAEYTTQLAAQQKTLEEMIRRIRAVLPVMIGYKDRGILTYDALGEMVLYVGDILGEPYEKRFKKPLHELVNSASGVQETVKRMGLAIDQLKSMVNRMSAAAHPNGINLDFGAQVIDDSVICIPIAGRTC